VFSLLTLVCLIFDVPRRERHSTEEYTRPSKGNDFSFVFSFVAWYGM